MLDTTKLTVGVSVAGLDLSTPPSAQVATALRSLLAEHQLLVFRGQALAPADQVRTLEIFGAVLDEKQDGKRYQYVSGDETSVRPGRLLFHSDNHFVQVPLELLSLYGEKVGENATSTMFVDNVEGYKRLPGPLARQLADLKVVNRSFFHLGLSDRAAREVPEELTGGPVARHPVIWHHPENGAPFVYLTELHAFRLEGYSPEESMEILGQVFATLYSPEHIYVHEWQNGDLVIWNNRTVQHARGELPAEAGEAGANRLIRRVSVAPISFSEQFSFAPEVVEQISRGEGSFYGEQIAERSRSRR